MKLFQEREWQKMDIFGIYYTSWRAAKQKIVEDLRRRSLKKIESLEQHEDWRRKKTRTAS